MALPLNKIGLYNFITLNGEVQSIGAKTDIYSRGGVRGLQAVQTGERGTPFTLRSTVDISDMTSGHDLYRAYKAMIGQTFNSFTVHDVDIAGRDSAYVLVLEVEKVLLRKCLKIVGGLSSGPTCLLVCDWQLVLIANPNI